MLTLIILLVSFFLFWLLNKYMLKDHFTVSFIGRSALATMLLFTGPSHFFKTEEMVQAMPEFFNYKVQLVYITGILEIAAAVGLLVQRTAKWTSIALILFFLSVLPANIMGSIKRVELGGMENGLAYLYFRVPLQILFIWWTYYFGIKRIRNVSKEMNTQ